MAEPVVERIAAVLATRVANVTTGNGYHQTLSVVRPTGTARDITPQHNRAVVQQDNPQPSDEHGYPGNPPAVAYSQLFLVIVYIRPSEGEATAIDTLINRAASDVVKAVRNDADWHTFGGNAIEAYVRPPMQFEHTDGSYDGVFVPFEVIYRFDESNPETAR